LIGALALAFLTAAATLDARLIGPALSDDPGPFSVWVEFRDKGERSPAELETLPASAAAGSVPGEVIAAHEELRHCTGCGKWYWEGSHVDRVRAWFEQVLGPPAG